MLARIHSAAILGIDARVVDVEVEVSRGLPRFTIVGLPDATVKEARERVRSALRNSGFPIPIGAVTVNLAPAGLRKAGAALDLPVALGLLSVGGLQPPDGVRRLYVGELGLSGEVRGVRGALSLAMAAREARFEEILVPADNATEAAAVEGIRVVPVESLAATVGHVMGTRVASDSRPSRVPEHLSRGGRLLRRPRTGHRPQGARDRRGGRPPRPPRRATRIGQDDARAARSRRSFLH